MNHDNEFKNEMKQELAGCAAPNGDGRMVVHHSDLPQQIPDGSRLTVRKTSYMKLKSGDFITVRTEEGVALRRFVTWSYARKNPILKVADSQEVEEISHRNFMGRVVQVETGKEKFDPNPNSWFSSLACRLTACGTRFGGAA